MAIDGPTIKGYLPVRICFPSEDGSEPDESFVFVKEHHTGPTLFVCNAPTVPRVQTKLVLKSLFGRFGEVSRVTVIDNPRRKLEKNAIKSADDLFQSWTKSFPKPSGLAPRMSAGRFAHVVYENEKQMKKAMRELCRLMGISGEETDLPGLSLETVEIQTLADETERLQTEEVGANSDNDEDAPLAENPTGIYAIAERYRRSQSLLSRERLLEECNKVMEAYEDAEEKERRLREAATDEPDADGFITVRPTTALGSKAELDENPEDRRRKGQKRNRKKKTGTGKNELQDFYRFQTKHNRKRSLQDLRQRFEEDLARVKKLKEEKQYNPF